MGNTAFGRMGEDRACLYLEEKGMVLVTRNFRCKHGEIDLIMKDGSVFVFVEVKREMPCLRRCLGHVRLG